MNVEDLGASWDQAAREDVMFNILTIAGKQGGRWDPDEFFERGRVEIEQVLEGLDDLGLRDGERLLALDFGCGVGRLTHALADHYARAEGVDVSGEMIERARAFARERDRLNCAFYVNRSPDLALFEDGRFDLIYSVITLQHMPRDLQRGYVEEFIRLLNHNGLAVFQLPEGCEYQHPQPWLSMYGTPPDEVYEWVRQVGAEMLDVELTEASGPRWKGWRYTARRLP